MPTQDEDTTEDRVEEYKPNRAIRRSKKPVVDGRATIDLLRNKRPREKEVSLSIPGPDGDQEATFLFRSIGAKEWELLVSKHKPTNAQRADGASFNSDTFPPALLARVCVEPEMSEEDWSEIWDSPDWSRGEITDLYGAAVNLCTTGFNIPFSASV
jgi:hypothetical protein